MLLKQRKSGHMVEVVNLLELINLNNDEVTGRFQEGEEVQEPDKFKKTELEFLSGEALPKCWFDPHYRDEELKRH
ncbi:MAG: acetyltransferase [Gammaproteobacteria bacterium]|nr:acetyltransferase [Gammaproteobacteria bacterium]